MRLCKVNHVDEVANAVSVTGVIVIAEYIEDFSCSDCSLGHEGYKAIRNTIWQLSDQCRRMYGVSVMELIDTFECATGVKVPYRIAPRRSGDVEQVWSDPSKANDILGWKATTPLADTLRNAWNWQLKLREKGIM